jgi:hypothetical protein
MGRFQIRMGNATEQDGLEAGFIQSWFGTEKSTILRDLLALTGGAPVRRNRRHRASSHPSRATTARSGDPGIAVIGKAKPTADQGNCLNCQNWQRSPKLEGKALTTDDTDKR